MHFKQLCTMAVLLLGTSALASVPPGSFISSLDATQQKDPAKAAPDQKVHVDAEKIRDLIKQLGDDSFDQREAADKQLAAIGEPALEFLQKAVMDSTDPEVRERCAQLVRLIGSSLFVQVREFVGHKTPNQPWVSRLVVTPDGRQAISIGADALRCWDLDSGKPAGVFGERKGPYCWAMAISADGKKAIIGCGGKQAHFYDLQIQKRTFQYFEHTGAVWGVALSADGKQAISGAADKTIRVWDTATGNPIRSFQGVQDEIRCLALSPDGKTVAAGHFSGEGQPGTVRLWDLATGTEIRALNGHKMEIACVAFSPDGKMLASTSFDGSVRLWDIAAGKLLKTLVGHSNRVECAAFTPDGKRLVSCGSLGDRTLRLWDVASGKQLLESAALQGGFFCVAVLPDGKQCVSAGGDGVVRLWRWAK